MDQGAFRNMLGRPRTVASTSAPAARPRNLITGEAGAKSTQTTTTQAGFKPRKLKDAPKLVSSDIDRRDDKGALDEIAQMVDSLRSGLPSSSAPGASDDLDATLEEAFESAQPSAAPEPPAPVAGKKRTREDIIRELREKKGAAAGSASPDPERKVETGAAKGFKPIGKKAESGFKPIGEKKKKKKKKKIAEGDAAKEPTPTTKESTAEPPAPAPPPAPPIPPEPEVDMDDDIFSGAGIFEGYDISDEEGEAAELSKPAATTEPAVPVPAKANWFNEPSRSPSPIPVSRRPPTPPPQPTAADDEEEEGEMRLQPLESSSIPSIRELLSMDKEEENRAKRRAKKDAWRAKQGLGPSERDGGDDWSDDEDRKKKKKKKGGLDSELNKYMK